MTFTLFLCRQYGSLGEKRGEEGEERERQHTALPGFQVCFSDQTHPHNACTLLISMILKIKYSDCVMLPQYMFTHIVQQH